MPHIDHPDAKVQIQSLEMSERCKKLAASEERPLRQIFNDVSRTVPAGGHHIAFPDIESAMYKRRRLSLPVLPTSCSEVDQVVTASRFAELDGEAFYRGTVDANTDGMAVIFASRKQLDLFQSASGLFFDGTFKVVPTLFLQLFTLFVPCVEFAFPAMFVLMSRKTQALYTAVFQKVQELVPQFSPTFAMSDFEEASTAAFRQVFGPVNILGCWFHFAQAIIKRVQKLGLKQAYQRNAEVQGLVHSLLGLPLLPASQIALAVDDLRQSQLVGRDHANAVYQLLAYVSRQWLNKASIGPDRLSVRDNASRTNNVLESFHAALKRRIQISHPNIFTFLGHLQRLTSDAINDVERIHNGLQIRRPKKKNNLINERRIKSCITRFDDGKYTRLQFLRAVSHSMGAHTEALHLEAATHDSNDSAEELLMQPTAPLSDSVSVDVPPPPTVTAVNETSVCEVCLVAPRADIALVPCGHARFCVACIDTVTGSSGNCPVCRSPIDNVIRIYI